MALLRWRLWLVVLTGGVVLAIVAAVIVNPQLTRYVESQAFREELARMPENIPVTFQDSGEHSLLFLTLLEKQLQRDRQSFARFLPFSQKVRRYCGDLAWGGTGEILIFA
jgi:uncharacterized membrane protein YraQ (UPF0718 family)